MRRLLFISTLSTILVACAPPDAPVETLSQIPLQDGSTGSGSSGNKPPPATDDASEDGGEDGGEAAACPVAALANPSCEACILSNCLSTCQTCAAYANCAAIWQCLNAKCIVNNVASQSCILSECAEQYLTDPTAVTDFSAFVAGLSSPGCLTSNCATECPSGP